MEEGEIKIDDKKVFVSWGIVGAVVLITLFLASLAGRVSSVEAAQNNMRNQYMNDVNELKSTIKTMAVNQNQIMIDVGIMKDRIKQR